MSDYIYYELTMIEGSKEESSNGRKRKNNLRSGRHS
jgi:hypothetical protein